ncbi:MAG: GH3 auxin-responsive promoter family protein [Anaerolineaceae bacterium]|nr:GH3 auxin-responsive promoter family protein [Anaerolineaceae bacterium]
MTLTAELIKQGHKEKVWSKYCGHLDLSMKEYMQIQERLMFEQFELLKDCAIGKKFFGNKPPKSINEFRERVPLTTYEDYVEFLLDKDENSLPKAHYRWARTSGRSGKYPCKWIPLTDRMYERYGEVALTAMILSSCDYKGDVKIEPGDVLLLATAPLPYTSGYVSHSTKDLLDVRFVPSLEEGEKMEFADRIAAGFSQGMETGIDYFYGLASVLGKMGERFEEGGSGKKSLSMLKPKVLGRLIRGYFKAKLQKRNLLPKDIWNLKGVMTGGMDTDIYREKVQHYWGKPPLEGYACTEGGMQALQAWNYQGMTLFPDLNFYEFIPFEEHLKNKEDPNYIPNSYLMNEIQTGIYEIVFTNLLGGVLMRYRVGDLINFVSLKDKELDCEIPQFRFYSRGDDLIDLSNMVRFNERSIWKAIDDTGIKYVDWTARKEVHEGRSVVQIYLELKPTEKKSVEEILVSVENNLKKSHPDFAGMEEILGGNNLKVTRLPDGAFNNYMESARTAGADLAHLKPPHMQPKDHILEKLTHVI